MRRGGMPLRVRGAHLERRARPLISTDDRSFAGLAQPLKSWYKGDPEHVASDSVALGWICADAFSGDRSDIISDVAKHDAKK
jgi:hypothetical protein